MQSDQTLKSPLLETRFASKTGLALLAITLVGAFLRGCHLRHGLPHAFYTDEGLYVYEALNIGGGNFQPFLYFNLYNYVCFFFDLIFIGGAKLFGLFHSFGDAWQLFKTDPTVYYFIGRLVNAIFGTLTIPLVYVIGKKIFSSRSIGLVSALFFSTNFLHIQNSQIGYKDTLLAFLICFALIFSLKALEKGRKRDYVLSGLGVGLAMSTKWNAPPLLMWGPLVSALRWRENKKNIFSGFWSRELFLFWAFVFIGFTAGTPFWLLNFAKFIAQMSMALSIFKFGGTGQIAHDSDGNWLFYLTHSLPDGFGYPIALLAAAGFIVLFLESRKRPAFILFLSFPLVYFAIAGSFVIHESRYMIPLAPFICIAAAFAMDKISFLLFRNSPRKSFYLFLLSLLFLFPSLFKTLRYNRLRAFPDTRSLAYEWLEKNIPLGKSILYSRYIVSIPKDQQKEPLDPTVFEQENLGSSLKPLSFYKEKDFSYLVLDEWHLESLLKKPKRKLHSAKIADRYRAFKEELDHAQLVAVFDPALEKNFPFDSDNVEFQIRSLWKVERLGPKIWIYRLSESESGVKTISRP